MARFLFSLKPAVLCSATGYLAFLGALIPSARAADMMSSVMNAPTTNSMVTPPAPPAGVSKSPATAPQMEEYDARYGRIVSPSSQPPYPFKLTMPSPGFGEVKVPHLDELAMREKLERLATLSDAEIRDQLAQWPAYSKMSLGDQGAMLTRIQQFRDRRTKVAQMKAHSLGLLTLNPQQQARFEQEYWDKQLQMDRQLAQQFLPIYQSREQKLNEDLFREFSSLSAPPAPKPPTIKPPVIKPPAPIAAAH